MVAHLINVQPVDRIELCFRLTAASCNQAIGAQANHVAVEVVGEYVLARVNGVTLGTEGTYLFELAVNGQTKCRSGFHVVFADSGSNPQRVH